MADVVTPLCSVPQFSEGAFADLAQGYVATTSTPLNDVLIEATRVCEGMAGDRRLAPFTDITETHRATGMDADEYTDAANLPMDIQGTLGMSYASSLGVSTLVRHCWLNQYAPRYPEMWAYGDITVTIERSYGGTEVLTSTQITGPEIDSGHLWFQLGTFLPIGSLIRTVYSGGFTLAVPADLVRACKYEGAAIIVRELNPEDNSHNPDVLEAAAEKIMARWQRT